MIREIAVVLTVLVALAGALLVLAWISLVVWPPDADATRHHLPSLSYAPGYSTYDGSRVTGDLSYPIPAWVHDLPADSVERQMWYRSSVPQPVGPCPDYYASKPHCPLTHRPTLGELAGRWCECWAKWSPAAAQP